MCDTLVCYMTFDCMTVWHILMYSTHRLVPVATVGASVINHPVHTSFMFCMALISIKEYRACCRKEETTLTLMLPVSRQLFYNFVTLCSFGDGFHVYVAWRNWYSLDILCYAWEWQRWWWWYVGWLDTTWITFLSLCYQTFCSGCRSCLHNEDGQLVLIIMPNFWQWSSLCNTDPFTMNRPTPIYFNFKNEWDS